MIKRDRDKLVWLDFTFIVFCPFGVFSWGWIKICLGHLETFSASSKDLLPEAFVYRKLMPDIFCHQEPQIQIKCLKSAKFLPGGAFFHHLFMFLDWSCDFLVLSSCVFFCQANADTPSAELVSWQREEQQQLPLHPTTQQNTAVWFFAVQVPVDFLAWSDSNWNRTDSFLPRSRNWNIRWTHWH